jgi:heme o synthase
MNAKRNPFVELCKPGITTFIGISALGGFVVAGGNLAAWPRALAVLFATMCMSAGAATLNHVLERDSDARMKRTSSRPLPSGRVSVREATAFALLATSIGLALSIAFLPWRATAFLILSHISYVHIYTPMKRLSPLCTLVGAIPGSLPVLAGALATNAPLGGGALALAGVLFAWQIPHFMAIGWLGRDDYARAGCPMLFVIDKTGHQSGVVSLIYAVVMLISAYAVALNVPTGVLYLAVSTIVGIGYISFAYRFMQHRERSHARKLFFASLIALPLMLGALAIDLLAY